MTSRPDLAEHLRRSADQSTKTAPMNRIKCICPGSPIVRGEVQCFAEATQEDLLCDHCREIDCPTITTWEIREERMLARDRRIYEAMKAL